MKLNHLWMPILAIVLAFGAVGVAGGTVYCMWQQSIAPVHATAPAAASHRHS